MDAVYWLQLVCVVLTVAEYASQIIKTYRTKKAEDLSYGYWFLKITITVLQIVILYISNNPLKVYLSQLLSLTGCSIVFIMMNYYNHKKKVDEE